MFNLKPYRGFGKWYRAAFGRDLSAPVDAAFTEATAEMRPIEEHPEFEKLKERYGWDEEKREFAQLRGQSVMRNLMSYLSAGRAVIARVERHSKAVHVFPRVALKWKVSFEVVNGWGVKVEQAVELEIRDPIDRKTAEKAARKAVSQKIVRFTNFQPIYE